MNGQLRLELGSIQGARKSVDPEVTKTAVRDFYSTRPKHLLMSILYSFADHYSIGPICGVRTQSQVNYLQSANAGFHAQYDSLWQELEGENDGSGFFILPDVISYKQGLKHPSHHPRRQRKRQELKDAITAAIRGTLATTQHIHTASAEVPALWRKSAE